MTLVETFLDEALSCTLASRDLVTHSCQAGYGTAQFNSGHTARLEP